MLAKMSNYNATHTATVGEANIAVSLLEKLTLMLACWRTCHCCRPVGGANTVVSLLEKLTLI